MNDILWSFKVVPEEIDNSSKLIIVIIGFHAVFISTPSWNCDTVSPRM